jgi:hypothetical protein
MSGVKTCTLLITFALGFGALAAAQETASSKVFLEDLAPKNMGKNNREWKMEFGGVGYTEGRDEGAAAELFLSVRTEYRFNSMLLGHFEPEADFFSGRLQERYDNDAYENRISMSSSYVSFMPEQHLELRAGSIRQDWLKANLLISPHRAFPGAQEILESKTEPVSVKLMAQQLIPSSYSLNTERSEKEPLPTFNTQYLVVEGNPKALFQLHGAAGHFNYSNLPSKVAFESGRAGNTVLGGEAVPGSRLAFGYDGYFGEAGVCLCGETAGVSLGFERQINTRAPNWGRDAQAVSLGTKFILRDYDFELRYMNYFIESDASVARYMPGGLGFTNRMGDAFEAEMHFRKQGFKLKGSYVNARTVANNPNQQTLSDFFLRVETDYAPF